MVTNDVLDSHSGDTTVATHAVYDDRVMATPISDDMTHLNSELKKKIARNSMAYNSCITKIYCSTEI